MMLVERQSFSHFLDELGILPGQSVMVHASYRAIRSAFPHLKPAEINQALRQHLSLKGSLIYPTFTYCFKRLDGSHEIFQRQTTPAKTGILAESFRQQKGVIRTASPTHSFALRGAVCEHISGDNAPSSPLGAHSVLEWLADQEQAQILLLGTDFGALSFGHYLEIINKLPWADTFPWSYMGVEPVGVSVAGEQALREVPGCSKSFKRFQDQVFADPSVASISVQDLEAHRIPVKILLDIGSAFFRDHPDQLLCHPGSCPACDSRRQACAS